MSFTTKGPDLTIAAAGTTSNAIYADGNYEGAYGVEIYAPAVCPEVGVIEVTDGVVANAATNVWRTLQEDTPADVAAPLAGKSRTYLRIPFCNGFRIKLAAVASQRVFNTSIASD